MCGRGVDTGPVPSRSLVLGESHTYITPYGDRIRCTFGADFVGADYSGKRTAAILRQSDGSVRLQPPLCEHCDVFASGSSQASMADWCGWKAIPEHQITCTDRAWTMCQRRHMLWYVIS